MYSRTILIVAGALSIVALSAIGAGVWRLAGRRPAWASTYTWTGLAVALCHLPLFHSVRTLPWFPAAYLGALAVTALATTFAVRRARVWLAPLRASHPAWLAGVCVLIAVALLLEVHYLRFRHLGWDAWWFWVPRAQFIFLDGVFSPAFWNVDHASYPPLVPAVTALYFHLLGAAGEMTALTAYWCLAFLAVVTFLERVGALAGGRVVAVASLLLYLFAPKFADGGLYYRELVYGHADLFWQLVFMAAVASALARGLRAGPALDEAGLLVVAALTKEEAAVLALAWAVLRLVLLATSTPGALRPALVRLAPLLVLVATWQWLLRHHGVESRMHEYALLMSWERYAHNLALVAAYLGKIDLLPVLLPPVTLLAVLPAGWRVLPAQRDLLAGLALVVLLGMGFTLACYLFYAGESLQWLIDTTFARLYGLPLLASLVLAAVCLRHHVRAGHAIGSAPERAREVP